jgi:hypothetical protein
LIFQVFFLNNFSAWIVDDLLNDKGSEFKALRQLNLSIATEDRLRIGRYSAENNVFSTLRMKAI